MLSALRIFRVVWALALTLTLCLTAGGTAVAFDADVRGRVESGEMRIGAIDVTLFEASSRDAAHPGPRQAKVLGQTKSGPNGYFRIPYFAPHDTEAVLYLVARRGPVALSTIVGTVPREEFVVINDLTSVASAYALAQFMAGRQVTGGRVGLKNAASMFLNLVDPATGAIGSVLASRPNGRTTSTMPTFVTLANISANCVRDRQFCRALFDNARPADGSLPRQSWPAFGNLAKFPGLSAAALFGVFEAGHVFYRPVLSNAPNAWTLPLRFDNDGTMNGPGNFAIDRYGNPWVINNYQPGDSFTDPVCAGKTLYRFKPNGEIFPGSPYTGGGIDGPGFGVTFDPHDNPWIGNFGFESPPCRRTPQRASHNRISKFDLDGKPKSPAEGYTNGSVFWPQGTVSDRDGNIWIANCGNGSVVVYPDGKHERARNILSGTTGIQKAFDVAIDPMGRVWVTGNETGKIAILDKAGKPVAFSPIADSSIRRPMGVSSNSHGNIWVSSSQVINPPCPDGGRAQDGTGGKLVLIQPDGSLAKGPPFEGGGISLPWGNAVDGKDNVFVANFGSGIGEGGSILSRISHFCGADTANCPQGLRTGDPISPDTGYTSDALDRITGVAVDQSGNLWAADNWKFAADPNSNNPGGKAVVAFVGLAAPIKTPLIGPPQQPGTPD